MNDGAIPDETTILEFRRLLEQHGLAQRMLEVVNVHLADKSPLLRQGTIIHAPSSTKNADKARDPAMRQTKKGNQRYFSMKAYIGADVESGLVHTVTVTPANEANVTQTEKLLHGREKSVHADAGYIGADKRSEKRGRRWSIAAKRGTVVKLPEGELKAATKEFESLKAAIRAKAAPPFRVIKRQFGYVKVRYRGLAKNAAQVQALFVLSNLWMARKRLLGMTG